MSFAFQYVGLALQERPGRVVNVASRMSEVGTVHVTDPQLAKSGAFSSVRAYGQSKLCQVNHYSENITWCTAKGQ